MYIKKNSLGMLLQFQETPDSVIEHYLTPCLDRFEKFEPHIHAFIHEENRETRILRDIEALKRKFTDVNKPPLYGIPVAIKDLFHVDGFPTHAGSELPHTVLTGEEGSLIRSLREKGMWITGKTVTEEFAYGGLIPTRNPHNLNHTSGGSSAGSAAAVAAGICPVAVGTQTLRSISAPASFCGVVGFKPSKGRIPMDGVILLSPSFDTAGFFTQDLPSMEYVSAQLIPEWQEFQSDRKPVLGIPNGIYMNLMFDDVRTAFQEQVKKQEESGYKIKRVDMPWSDEFIYGDDMLRFVQGEMAIVHQALFEEYKDIYGLGVHNAITAGFGIDDMELERYRKGQISLRNDLSDIQEREAIDLWISPAQGGTAPLWGEQTGWAGMTAIWSYAGLPTISIPSMTVNDMPLGFQCIGSYGGDEELIYWSKQVSKALNPDYKTKGTKKS
ncbi:amidase [Paenibacillus sp. KQZ6P-2]|uniref:Amidase n=1 Tax=Paenibacillus mangrovi TaxID=2931978 RepID=A0A9X1WSD4_9BACL|nr:amidase [Paenibacillus mangrovi]MCJ8013746.1 amidase [Paenibacillus mangrovi]